MFDQERSYQAERLNLLRTQVAVAVEADTIATQRTRQAANTSARRSPIRRSLRLFHSGVPHAGRPSLFPSAFFLAVPLCGTAQCPQRDSNSCYRLEKHSSHFPRIGTGGIFFRHKSVTPASLSPQNCPFSSGRGDLNPGPLGPK
jgi:hypothetical protein